MNEFLKVLLLAASVSLVVGCGLEEEGDETEAVSEESEEQSEEVGNGTVGSIVGVPDVDSFSLAVESAVIENAQSVDGVTMTFTAHAGDRHNHPVQDGTRISFWTEYGIIEESCETTGGACSVTWTSMNRRPLDGLATVTAFTIGEDSFFDSGERNGIYNVDSDSSLLAVDEVILSTEELYFDRNYDGYTSANFSDLGSTETVPGDAFEDYNEDGQFNASSSKYRGTRCSAGAISEGHCDETQIQVWDHTQVALSLSSDFPIIVVDAGPWTEGNNYTVTVADSYGNYPPAGTSIDVSGETDTNELETTYNGGAEVLPVGEATKNPHTFSVTLNDPALAGGIAKITVGYKGQDYSYTVNYAD